VRRLVEHRQVKAYRVGGQSRVLEPDLRLYLAAKANDRVSSIEHEDSIDLLPPSLRAIIATALKELAERLRGDETQG